MLRQLDPAGQGQARPHPATTEHGRATPHCLSSRHHSSRSLTVRRVSQLSGLRNAVTTAHTASFQTPTAFAGSHAAQAPACAPPPPPPAAAAAAAATGSATSTAAAAAATAPTTMQDLIAQVVHEESTRVEQYCQQHHHLSRNEQMQLHQLQHHDQLLLQQQLEHLHQQQQHHQQRQWQEEQQQQQVWQEEEDVLPPPSPQQPQQQQQQQQQEDDQRYSRQQRQQWRQQSSTQPQQWQVLQQPPQQQPWQERSPAHLSDRRVQQQAAHVQQQPTYNTRAAAASGTAVAANGTSRTSSHVVNHSSSSSSTRVLVQEAAAAVTVHSGHAGVGGSIANSNPHGNANSAAKHAKQQSNRVANKPRQQPQRQHVQQQQQLVQQHMFDRTPAGLPIVRVHRGSKPARVAAVLCGCLLQEQQVVLSAAGAELALLALQCLERAICLQQQQQPASTLLAVPHVTTSRRPDGRGRCQLYDLVCSVQPQVDVEDVHEQQQEASDSIPESTAVQLPGLDASIIEPSSGNLLKLSTSLPQQQQQQVSWQQLEDQSQPRRLWPAQQPVLSSPVGFCTGHAVSSSVCAGSSSQQLLELQAASLPLQAHHHQQHLQQQPVNSHSQGHHRQQQQQEQQQQRLPKLVMQDVSAHAAVGCVQPRFLQPATVSNGNGRHHHHQQQLLQHAPQPQAGAHLPASPVSQRPQQQQPQQSAAVHAAPAASVSAITQLKVSGCSVNFADTLEDALAASPAGVVQLPVAHAKQAVRALEAVRLVSQRWQQQHQQQLWRQRLVASPSGSGGDDGAGDESCAMQLVVQPHRGKVWGQGGGCTRGLFVFVYAAPIVQ